LALSCFSTPPVFVVCVAAALGPEGWISIGGTAAAGWALWQGANDLAEAKARYEDYLTISGYPAWDANVAELYRLRYEDAQSTQRALWIALAGGSATTSYLLYKAVKLCTPTLAIPV
jgi:hypothetical protein